MTETDNARRIWEAALGELEIQVSRHNYQTWLAKTEGLNLEGDNFFIGVPNAFVAAYLERNQCSLIEKTLIGLTRRELRAVFTVSIDAPARPVPASPLPAGGTRTAFNPRYTFAQFITGQGNELARAAAAGVVEDPGASYNPLFIYGGVGLGKTHLLHAIGQEAIARQIRVAYVSGERFTNDFITAVQDGLTEDFRKRYRDVDILMLDDVQFISGKAKTEECFFHTFNELHDRNRQIVLTSDQQPQAMSKLAARLRSRFAGGLVADIQPPDVRTRLDILKSKVTQRDEDVPEATLELIAQRSDDNIRELEGSLNRVLAYARLLQAPATPELAITALTNIGAAPTNQPAAPTVVIAAVAGSFDLIPEDLTGLKRDKEINLARQIAMYLIREQGHWPLAQIGQEFSRNPSTVRHACDKIGAELDSSPWLRRRLTDLRRQLTTA